MRRISAASSASLGKNLEESIGGAEMLVKWRLNHLNLKDVRNYRLYFSGILVEVLAVLLLMGIGFLLAWLVPRLIG
jgi:hypothetical protein